MWSFAKKHFLSTGAFYKTSLWLRPLCFAFFIVTFLLGSIGGLFIAPPDYQQGEGFRIIYVHVPAAFTAMSIYFVLALSAFITLVWRIKITALCMSASARIGIWMTLLALVTGSLWGKPMWGTFWIWDARLTSVLILFFLYLGFITLQNLMPNNKIKDRVPAVLALAGSINLPIIHYSVIWWSTLHQGPSLSRFAKPAIEIHMLWPLLCMIAAFQFFYLWILFRKISYRIIAGEKKIV